MKFRAGITGWSLLSIQLTRMTNCRASICISKSCEAQRPVARSFLPTIDLGHRLPSLRTPIRLSFRRLQGYMGSYNGFLIVFAKAMVPFSQATREPEPRIQKPEIRNPDPEPESEPLHPRNPLEATNSDSPLSGGFENVRRSPALSNPQGAHLKPNGRRFTASERMACSSSSPSRILERTPIVGCSFKTWASNSEASNSDSLLSR